MLVLCFLLRLNHLYIVGIWVFVTMLPTLMLNSSERDRPLGNLDVIGWGLWAIGMGFEVIADFQKSAFRRNPNNKVQYLINLIIISIIYRLF